MILFLSYFDTEREREGRGCGKGNITKFDYNII